MSPVLRPCMQPGCAERVERGRCSRHVRKKRLRGTFRERGYDRRWDRVSRSHRKRHPLCQDCEERGETRPAALVHHIVPVDVDRSRLLDPANLRSLCRDCHAKRHAT